jgi:membrane protein
VLADWIRRSVGRGWDLGTETYDHWRDHRTIRLGAGLAYYGLFALVPMLAVALAIAGSVISQADVQSYLAEQLSALLGVDADAVAGAAADLLDGTGRLASLGLVGAVSLILTASLLVLALQDALNTIWERPVRLGIRHTLMRRLVAFVVVAGAGGVLILSFALNAVTGFLNQLVPDVAVVESLQEVVGLATSWALAIGVVALLFRYLPDVRVSWVPVLIGATVTALLLAVGTVLVGAYLRRYAASSLVGVTGSVLLVLLWIYYEAQIVLAGAEFTRVLAHHRTGCSGSASSASSAGSEGKAGAGPGDDAAVDVGG